MVGIVDDDGQPVCGVDAQRVLRRPEQDRGFVGAGELDEMTEGTKGDEFGRLGRRDPP